MISRTLKILTVVTLGMVALTGCSTDNAEHERLVVEVDMVNGGVPLVSAYLNAGNSITDPADDYTPIDWVSVLFRARPLNSTMHIPENGAYSWFHITGYDMTWGTPAGAGAPTAAELSAYNVRDGLIDVIVPVNDEGIGAVMVADPVMKSEPWFAALNANGTSFSAFLTITFRGHVSSSEHVVEIPSGIYVNFIGYLADAN